MEETPTQPTPQATAGRWLIEAVNAVVDSGAWADFKPDERAVFLPLVRSGNPQGQSFRGLTSLARLAGVSRSTVIRALNKLQARGMLQTEHRLSAHGDAESALRTLTVGGVVSPVTPPSSTADTRGSVTADTRVVAPVTPGVVSPVTPKESHRKRLKEESQGEGDSCPEPVGTPLQAEPALLEFPVVGKGAKTWALTESFLKSHADAYPGIDALAEAKRALAWLNANRRRRKTGEGMPRFLNNWFARSQDRAGERGRSSPNPRASRSAGQYEENTPL